MLEEALQYAEMGYRIFPCQPGGKAPACEHGCLDATTNTEVIEKWWTERPDCNIGLATDGLLVIDIDGKDNPWRYDIGEEKTYDLMACPAAHTPSGGRHLFFKQPEGKAWRNTASAIADKVDTRANGGYVVAPPSRLANGGGYQWGVDRELESNLDEPPQWLDELLDGDHREPSGPRSKNQPVADPIPSGQRNSVLASIGGGLRRIGLGVNAIDAALQSINCQRCSPPMNAKEVRKIAESVYRYEPDQIATIMVEGTPNLEPYSKQPPKFDEAWLDVPGFINEVMEYNLSGAYRRQPILALAGALALLSTITGRKVCDDIGTRTNLLVLAVANSGTGKERARKVNKELLYEAGVRNLIGPESPASATGIVSALDAQPALLFQWDEVGRLLQSIGGDRVGPHLQMITTTLMKLYTSSDTIYLGDAYADAEKNRTINQPHAVLHGTTVPSNLYSTFSAEAMIDGFLARMLIFESNNTSPDHQEPVAKDIGPLVEQVKYWTSLPTAGNLGGVNPAPDVIAPTDEASQAFRDFVQETTGYERSNELQCGPLWARAPEKARKLALLHACSRRESAVDIKAANWGINLARHLTEKLLWIGGHWVSESKHEEQTKKVIRFLQECGGKATSREIYRKPLRSLKKSERESVLESLLTMELIGMREEKNSSPNPSKVFYLTADA